MGNVPFAAEERPLGLSVIEIVRVNNLPNMDVGSLTDAYLILSFRSCNNPQARINGIELKTQTKNNNLNPVFHSFEEFPFIPQENDLLSIKVLDHDVTSHDDKVGKASILMSELLSKKQITIPLAMQTRVKAGNDGITSVTIRLVYSGPRPLESIKKTIFLIRHGESKWNISQSENNLKGMVRQYDHELTETGLQQASLFNQRWKFALTTSHESDIEDYQSFVNASVIYSSPLTRATQTALLTCEGHEAFKSPNGKLTLLSSLREVKNFGSFDTVGRYSGEEISKHVHEMLKRDLGEERCQEVLKPTIDFNDAQEQWWTALEVQESKSDVNLRLKELWNYLRYGTEKDHVTQEDASVVILVGHSHYFRQLLRENLSPEYREREMEWTTELSQKKLDNAACLRITVVWKYPQDTLLIPGPVIEEAKLVFDSKLVGEGEGDASSSEREE
jgi:broad specificity phosphatase PhoE